MHFDPATFNWAALLLTVSALLFLAFGIAVRRRPAGPAAIFTSLAFLLTACKSAAAPFRGLLDPAYVGYGFGLLQADKGWSVTLVAGSVVIFGAAAAFAALRPERRAATLVAGAVGLAFLALQLPVFLPLLLSSPHLIVMQFGQYLTVPPVFAIPIGLYMIAGYSLATARVFLLFARRQPLVSAPA